MFGFECAGSRQDKHGKPLDVNEEVPLLYAALSRLSNRIDNIQEEHSELLNSDVLQSPQERTRITLEWQSMQQEFHSLKDMWHGLEAANKQRDIQWSHVQQVLRKFFEQHNFELQQMHE